MLFSFLLQLLHDSEVNEDAIINVSHPTIERFPTTCVFFREGVLVGASVFLTSAIKYFLLSRRTTLNFPRFLPVSELMRGPSATTRNDQ